MSTATDIQETDSAANFDALQSTRMGPSLAVDLDGTLVKTDLLLESLLLLLKHAPWRILSLPVWLRKGRAYFKEQVARRVSLDAAVLPYRKELIDYLQTQRAQGRPIVLATAADAATARDVADHLGIFDLILSSDGVTNLSDKAKRDLLVNTFGEKGFDYAGNSKCDLVVWQSARQAIAVNPSRSVRAEIAQLGHASYAFDEPAAGFKNHLKALRPHHWLKNLLVFAPLLAAHRIDDMAMTVKLAVAFLSLGCIASSGYLINDLLDLPADRHHPNKRLRPFAAGDLPLTYALEAIPALFFMGIVSASFVSGLFLAAALTYFALTMTYSLFVKRFVILDVIFLAGLYTMRILAGSAAIAIWPSHWLLALSTFLFFSMALVKRYGELVVMRHVDGEGAKARSYESSDGELLAAMGIASGYLAVLVLALYINSDKAQVLYGHYPLMWFLCPLLLYWISDIWLVAHRGRMPDDPVFFALRDRTSQILILLMLAISVLAL